MTDAPARDVSGLLPPKARRKPRIGLVAGGLGTYWPQFPDLLPQLQESARYVSERFQQMDADVTDVGFISDAQEGAAAAEQLRREDCDLIVLFLTTYLTSSMVLPIAQRANTPVLVIDLQPTEKMDHASFDTGAWLAYCGQCPVPEVGNVFRRAGIPFRSVSGWLRQESAWERIGQWIRAAHVRAALRHGRHGLMGHLYPGMLDVSTDLTLLPTTFGSHVEVLEFDDLRVRVDEVTDAQVADRMALARELFTLDDTVDDDDFAWGAKVSVGLDRLVDDFDLDSLAYYHRGLEGEQHERLGAGMILGASLLTARGIPATGEYELRTTVAQLATQVVGAGGSFCEIRRSTSRTAWSRWATTARRTSRFLHATRCCGGSACTTASEAGASRSNSTCSPARSRCSDSGRTATAVSPSWRPRAPWCRVRCSRSAIRPVGSTSGATPASGSTNGRRPASATTGRCR
jgi:L-arabinose isomerase